VPKVPTENQLGGISNKDTESLTSDLDIQVYPKNESDAALFEVLSLQGIISDLPESINAMFKLKVEAISPDTPPTGIPSPSSLKSAMA